MVVAATLAASRSLRVVRSGCSGPGSTAEIEDRMSTRTTTTTDAKDADLPKLVFRSGPCRGKVLLIERDRVSFGREEDNDVVIDDDIVSSRHAILWRELPEAAEASSGTRPILRLQDLGSKNGTFVNGERVESAELAEGDVIWFCQRGQEVELTYREPELPSLLATSTSTYGRTGSIASAVRELLPQSGHRQLISATGVRELVAGTLEESSRRQRRTVILFGGLVSGVLVIGFVLLAALLGGDRTSGGAGGGRSVAVDGGAITGEGALESRVRPRVRVDVDVRPIFSSLFDSYREDGIGEICVENRGDEPVDDLQLSVDLTAKGKRLLAEAMRFEVPVLAPSAQWKAELRPVLTGDIVTDRSLVATIVARVVSDGEEISSFDRAVMIHDYHAFSWERPERVTIFVDSNDAAVRAFADAAWARQPEVSDRGFPPANVVRSVTLLSALASHGVRYKPDARTPVSVSRRWKAGDRLNFPGETLLSGTGDCDDLVVLCCSLLETAGVSSAVVVGEDHVLLMLDTGLPAPGVGESSAVGERTTLFSRGSFVTRGGRMWMPIEATELARKDGTFSSAWGAAWSRVEAIEAGRMSIIEVRQGWKRYRPLHPSPSDDVLRQIRDPSSWRLSGLRKRIETEIRALQEHGRDNLNDGQRALEEEYDGAELAQARALLYANAGLYLDAVDVLERELYGEDAPRSAEDIRVRARGLWKGAVPFDAAVLLADLGLDVTLASSRKADLDRAVACLDIAISGFPDDLPEKAEMMLRLGLVHLIRGELGPYRRWKEEALARDPDLEPRLEALLKSTGAVASAGESPRVAAFLKAGIRRLRADRSR